MNEKFVARDLLVCVSWPGGRVTLNKAERRCGGAGRFGVDVTAGLVIVGVTDVSVVDPLINVFDGGVGVDN